MKSTKGKNPVIYNPISNRHHPAVDPKAAVDKVPILSMAYGCRLRRWQQLPVGVHPPATYWDGASVFIRHVLQTEGGNIKGRPSALIHLDAPFGKEPIPVLEACQGQGIWRATWTLSGSGRADSRPELCFGCRSAATAWTGSINQGWGAMNPTAVKEA